MMKNKIVNTTLLVLVVLFSGCKEQPESSNLNTFSGVKFMQTMGAQIIAPNGEPIVLKGTNLGNWLVPEGYMFKMEQVNSPRKIDELLYELIGPDSLQAFWTTYLDNYITHEDIKYLKQIGCNHIRLPFHYKLFTEDLYMGHRYSGFKYFDRIIDWCKQENLYILLDMHCAPGGQTGDNIDDSYGYPYLFKSQSSQDLFTEIWLQIADRYRNEPIIIGYDLMNEPVAHYFSDELDFFNEELFKLYRRVISEIREIDANHVIFLNGSVWSGNFEVFKEMMGENIVYEFHKYWFPVEQEAVQEYLDFSNNHQVPIYIGETGENTDEWIDEFRTLLDSNQIPWAFWPYKKMNNTRGIMNFEEPQYYHLISEYAKSDRSSYKKRRENRPDTEKVQIALNEFLENSLFKNNFQNEGYIKALGLRVE